MSPARHALQLAMWLRDAGMAPDEAAALAMRTLAPAAPVDLVVPAPSAGADGPVVEVVGQRLPRDAFGNRYETDAAGNQLVYLAGGGMLVLPAGAAATIGSGGVALPGWAALSRLAQGTSTIADIVRSGFNPAALAGLLMGAPGNLGSTTHQVMLAEDLRFEQRHGELYGTVYERTPGADWLARPERYIGMPAASGFVVLSEDEYARLRDPIHTPVPQPPGPGGAPPLVVPPTYRPGTPGYEAAPPAGPNVEVYPAELMRLDDLIVESRGLAPGTQEHKAAAWDLYNQRPNDGWDYDRWSSVYDSNQSRASAAREVELAYHAQLGWGDHQVTVYPVVDGEASPRRLDIADVDTQRGIEVKSGYQSAGPENRWELERDAALVAIGWQIEWVFTGTASQPLLEALNRAGIKVTFKP